MNRALRIAFVCGVVPMLAGVAIFLMWLVTRRDSLILAGTLSLYAGVAVVTAGFTALAVYVWLGLRIPNVARGSVWRAASGPAALLLSNFAVALLLGSAVLHLDHAYRVTIQNASAQPLTDVRLSGGGGAWSFQSIPAGGESRQQLQIKEDGTLEFRGTHGPATLQQTVESDLKKGKAGHLIITVNADGTVTLRYQVRA